MIMIDEYWLFEITTFVVRNCKASLQRGGTDGFCVPTVTNERLDAYFNTKLTASRPYVPAQHWICVPINTIYDYRGSFISFFT